jgi:hypothetical protein
MLDRETREAHFTFPITKVDRTPDGDLLVYGPVTDGTLDADHQRVDTGWSGKALHEWIVSGGNIRVQHSPFLYPAGKGLALETFKDGSDQHWLKALVVKATPAHELVEKKILCDFSIGVLDPVTTYGDYSAPGGTICGGKIGEVSLVDRGSNKNTTFTIVKSAADGPAELVCKVHGGGMPNPVDVRRAKYAVLTVPEVKRKKLVDSGGRDVSDVPGQDFAGPGRTYPIKTRDDVSDAASLAHHADDPGTVRSKIRSIASRKFGMKDDEMPSSLKADDDPDCSTCHGSGKIRDGHVTCPDCHGSGNMTSSVAEKGDAAEDYPGDSDSDDDSPADYDDDDADDSKSKGGKADKAIDARALRKRLVKKQRRVLKAMGDNGGRTPADVTGHRDDGSEDAGFTRVKRKKMKPAGKHREPDGPQAEGTEHDAGMDTSPEAGDKTGVPGSDWSGKSDGPSFGIRRLHDACCPAFRWRPVREAYSLKSVSDALPLRELQTLAMDAVAKSNFDLAEHYTSVLGLASQMRQISPDMLSEARKAFPDLFPDTHPSQQSGVHPSQFTRGFSSTGVSALSAAGPSGSKLPGVPVRHITASQFSRDFIAEGRASKPPGEGTQATAGTAAFGQALNTLASMHQRVSSMWPEMCPVSMTQHDYTSGEGGTGIRPGSLPAPSRAPGETANKSVEGAVVKVYGRDIGIEPQLRKKLAKAQRKIEDQEEEIRRLGAMPSTDPDDMAFRGLPELDGPVDRKSHIGKAVGAGGDDDTNDDEFLSYMGGLANSGNPTVRANARKVLEVLITK